MFYTFTALSSSHFLTQLKDKAGWVVVSESRLEIPAGGFIELSLSGNVLEFSASPDGVEWLDLAVMPKIPLSDQPFDVWLSVNSRRITGVLGISGFYHPFYIGLIRPFVHSGIYPFPCFLGGSNAGAFDDVSESVSSYLFLDSEDAVAGNSIYMPDGDWKEVGHYSGSVVIHPFDTWAIEEIGKTLDGQHVLYPALVMTESAFGDDLETEGQQVLGYLDGVYAVSAGEAEEITGDFIMFPDLLYQDHFYALEMK